MIVDGGRGKMKWRGVGSDPRLHLELKWRVRADRRGGGDGGARQRRCELGVGAGGGWDGRGVVKRRRGAFYRRARSVEEKGAPASGDTGAVQHWRGVNGGARLRAGDEVMRRLGAGVDRRRRRCAEVAGAVGEYRRAGPAAWFGRRRGVAWARARLGSRGCLATRGNRE